MQSQVRRQPRRPSVELILQRSDRPKQHAGLGRVELVQDGRQHPGKFEQCNCGGYLRPSRRFGLQWILAENLALRDQNWQAQVGRAKSSRQQSLISRLLTCPRCTGTKTRAASFPWPGRQTQTGFGPTPAQGVGLGQLRGPYTSSLRRVPLESYSTTSQDNRIEPRQGTRPSRKNPETPAIGRQISALPPATRQTE